MFDKEIRHYNIIISEYIPATGKYRYCTKLKRNSEKEAVSLARALASENTNFKIRIEQVANIVGWWED